MSYPHHLQEATRGRWGGGGYLVSVQALRVLWSRDPPSFTPFLKVLREQAFQLEAADVIQLLFAGRDAPEGNAGGHGEQTETRSGADS